MSAYSNSRNQFSTWTMAVPSVASLVGLLDSIGGSDILVLQGGQGTRFAFEASHALAILREFLGQELQGHFAAEFVALGA